MKKRALITGITGQDGSYLAELLLEKGYEVYGLLRRSSTDPLMRIEKIALARKARLLYGDVRDSGAIARALAVSRPHEIYNLAAQSDVGISFMCPEETWEINYYGVGRVVNEAIRNNKRVKIYQASTSEMFGNDAPPQNEKTPFAPVSPYAEAKMKAHQDFVEGYRKRHGIFICSGILFNHESPRRGEHFVTRKITLSLAKIAHGLQSHVELGNLDAKRDWGFAGDYVEAMWAMLQRNTPEDFVIATGESRTVREFVEAAAKELGKQIVWKGKGLNERGVDESGKTIVRVNKKFYRPTDPHYLLGDSKKARRMLLWKPKTSFSALVSMMVQGDMKYIRGKANSLS